MKLYREEFTSSGRSIVAYLAFCPACRFAHRFIVSNGCDPDHIWSFNGDVSSPAFDPSLKVTSGDDICHSYLRGGVWTFLDDSTHGVVGGVSMLDFPLGYGL